MGYPPLPPRGAPHIVRGRRAFLRCVPGPDSLWKHIACEMEVLPYKQKWEWRVRLLYDGHRDPGCVDGGGWRRRHAGELRGRCRDQGDAWRRARSLVNDVRALNAAVQVVQMRRHTERVPL